MTLILGAITTRSAVAWWTCLAPLAIINVGVSKLDWQRASSVLNSVVSRVRLSRWNERTITPLYTGGVQLPVANQNEPRQFTVI